MEIHAKQLAVYFAAAITVYCVAWIIYTRILHPLARFPGPFWATVSRAWLIRQVCGGHPERVQKKLHDQYGPIVRVAPNELIFSDPETIKSIYGVNSGFIKSDFYHAFRAPVGRFPDHFSSDNQKVHAERRRIVNPVYSLHSVPEAEQYVDGCIDVLLEQFSDIADKRECIDLYEWSRFFAYDTIGELFFGKMFGFLRSRYDHLGFTGSADYLIPVMTLSGLMPMYLRPVFMLTGTLFPGLRKAAAALGILTDASNRVVAERVQPGQNEVKSERLDFITKVLQIYRKKGSKVDFDIEDVKTEAWLAYFGGGDTTAIYLCTTLYYILQDTKIYERVQKEIDRATEEGRISSTHITYREASTLSYLQACIKEAARIHPVVALPMPRKAPPQGCTLSGAWIPGGTKVGVNSYVTAHNAEIFGAEPEKFNPERWLKADADKRGRYILQFGAGSRTCMGKHIALSEIYKVIPEVLRSFRLELVKTKMETTGFWFFKPESIPVRVYRRT